MNSSYCSLFSRWLINFFVFFLFFMFVLLPWRRSFHLLHPPLPHLSTLNSSSLKSAWGCRRTCTRIADHLNCCRGLAYCCYGMIIINLHITAAPIDKRSQLSRSEVRLRVAANRSSIDNWSHWESNRTLSFMYTVLNSKMSQNII